jgi:chromosome segregation protein
MLPRLKSLELQGYKTFAIRTLFEFPGMITAVVGPNGSGKSNIADALRWVLGEQSYSILRGKKTEDMIFAGSEQRPRAGMASATITFDNSDGWLPVDFVEVAITRRAFRDGQNEYLLNGQRVRLREISELLAQCGLSERTYTVIGQGLVDAALALKPEERRRLFEEAAGIGLYRSRKEEALHRLETTQRNLERVQDILAEIEPRLLSLEKQARRVQEYERIRADLKILLREWYGYHWFQAQRELNRVLEILKTQENRLAQARQRQEETAKILTITRSQILDIRTQLNEQYAQSAQVNNLMQQVSRDLAIAGERLKSLADTQRSLDSDLGRAEEESNLYLGNLKAAEDEKQALSDELKNAHSQAQISREGLQNRRKEREAVEKLIRDARGLVVTNETRQVQLRARQQEINQRLEGLQTTLQKFTRDLANAELELKKTQDRLSEADQSRQSSEAAHTSANVELRAVQKKIAESDVEKKKIQDQRLQFENDAARLKVQMHALQQAEESYNGYTEGARFFLQAVKQGRFRGEFRTLSSLVDVPQEFEVAIAAALGEYLDLIILSGNEDPENIFRFIERDSKGRVAFLPLVWAVPDEPVAIPEDADCFGSAVSLIQNEPDLNNIVKIFLSNVIVVKNRAAAHRLLKEMPVSTRAVTLRGELFSGSGPVLAGAPGRTGTIGRKRQLRELGSSFEKLNSQIEQKNSELSNLEQGVTQLRVEEAEKSKQIRLLNERADKDRKNYQAAQLALEQIQRQLQWQNSQKTDLGKQELKGQDELAQSVKELESVEVRLGDARNRVRQLSAELSRLPMDEYQTQVAHWETACAVCARALTDAEKRSIERQQILDVNSKQINRLKSRLAETTRTAGELAEKKNSLQQSEKDLADQIHARQAVIDPLAVKLATLEKEFENQQAVDTAAQQALTVSERYHTQASLDHTRHSEAMESLRRRIEEDIGLVALEYEANVSGPNPLPFEGLVDQLPLVTEIAPTIDESISRQRAQLRRMGAINLEAQTEYNSVLERYNFMTDQVADLRKADASLHEIIAELDGLMKRDFTKTFNAVAVEFKQMFTRLFGGGTAHLVLFDEENPQDSGIEIEARLPGRREQGLSLLSGGERSLTAAALVFALLKVSPTPFCVMDEVDAMLDEANVGRFVSLLRELSLETQFIVITHNRNTVQSADIIYGVTMGRDSISQLISLKLDEISEEMVV